MNNTQTWQAIPGWEGLYEVGSHGVVRSVPRVVTYRNGIKANKSGKPLATHLRQGFPYVTLADSGLRKTYRVARLVLAAHTGPCPKGCGVGYADGDTTNVALANLSYAPRGKHKD